MPYATGSYSTAESAAYASDHPIFVGHNLLRDSVDARWTATGTQTGADLTSPMFPTYRAWDGRALSPTRSYDSGASTVYFNIQIPASEVDTISMQFLRAFPSSTLTVQIANDAAFTSSVATFAGPFTLTTGLPRHVRSFNGTRYTGLEYIRLRFVKDSGTYGASTLPQIVECTVGRGRVLGLGWAYGSDEDPERADGSSFEARSGDKTRYTYYRGKHLVKHSQTLSSTNFHGLDDVATVRAIADESLGYTRPIVYIPRPTTALNRALFGFLPKKGLDLSQEMLDGFDYELEFDELPFYRALEG